MAYFTKFTYRECLDSSLSKFQTRKKEESDGSIRGLDGFGTRRDIYRRGSSSVSWNFVS